MTTRIQLTGAKVFDGRRFLTQPHDVIVEDGRLGVVPTAAGPQPGAELVDLAGKTLTPGIIDTHVHLASNYGTALAAFAEPFSLKFYRAAANLSTLLDIGVTTVREAGGADRGMRDALEQGLVEGPRATLSISIMAQTGGHGDLVFPSGHTHPLLEEYTGRPSGVADGPDGVRRKTREILRAGADHIKICSTGGVLSPGDDPHHAQFSEAEIRVIVEEAEEQGAYVLSHAQSPRGISRALRAGVRSIEHGIFLDDESIQLFLDRDAYLVPTMLVTPKILEAAAAGEQFAPGVLDKARRAIEAHHDSAARARQAGVRIAMGTDANARTHGSNLEELGHMCDFGMTVAESLSAATAVAAELMRIDDLGVIRDGAIADLVVFDTDLEHGGIGELASKVEQVWQSGARVR